MRKLKIIEHISLHGVIQFSGEGNFPTAAGLRSNSGPKKASPKTPVRG